MLSTPRRSNSPRPRTIRQLSNSELSNCGLSLPSRTPDSTTKKEEKSKTDCPTKTSHVSPAPAKNKRENLTKLMKSVIPQPEYFSVFNPFSFNLLEFELELSQLRGSVDAINAGDLNGETALHKAAKFGNEHAVGCLLDAGANPEIKDNFGRTPLFLAEFFNQPAVIRNMLSSAPKKLSKGTD